MNLKEKIHFLAKEKGISIPALEKEAGLGKSTISKWDKSSPTIEKLQAVADRLDVNVSDLLDETVSVDITDVNDDDLKFALFGGESGITDEQLAEVKRFAEFVKERDSKK